MPLILLILYNAVVVPSMAVGFFVGSLFNGKLEEGRRARKNQFVRLEKEIAGVAPHRNRILFHCTSAGEWLQAVPLIEAMKSINPDLFIMVSFFSPSGFRFARNPAGVDLKLYLPLDSSHAARRLFELLRPRLWIISKFDIWPNHVLAASDLRIPIVITSATLSPDSRRDKGISKYFNAPIFKKISHFFPISEDDKKRFQELVPDERLYTVAGDTRFDHVYNQGEKARSAPEVHLFDEKRGATIIAGSTWPADEKHVLPGLARLLKELPDLRAIVVPHEVHESHLRDIERVFSRSGVDCSRYTGFSGTGTTTARVVLFDAVGMLARLYRQTDLAFVGGSFGKGTHNVMEPAIFGQPVLFGPNYLNSHEAGELLSVGAAFRVADGREFYEKASLLLKDESLRKSMGEKARDLIAKNTGATTTIMNKLTELYDFIS
jgi:3-deoxy-D-manno-octulosonic-acid transferase